MQKYVFLGEKSMVFTFFRTKIMRITPLFRTNNLLELSYYQLITQKLANYFPMQKIECI